MTARVLLIRAGATEWDAEDRFRGDLDLPLSAAGRAEVVARARQVEPYRFAVLWAGSDQPARETAALLAEATGRRFRTHPGLREVALGYWQALVRGDVRRKHRRCHAEWSEDPSGTCPPGGEPLPAAATRLTAALADIARRQRGDALLAVVCGPFAAATLTCLLTDRPLRECHAALADTPPVAVVGAGSGAGGPPPAATPAPVRVAVPAGGPA